MELRPRRRSKSVRSSSGSRSSSDSEPGGKSSNGNHRSTGFKRLYRLTDTRTSASTETPASLLMLCLQGKADVYRDQSVSVSGHVPQEDSLLRHCEQNPEAALALRAAPLRGLSIPMGSLLGREHAYLLLHAPPLRQLTLRLDSKSMQVLESSLPENPSLRIAKLYGSMVLAAACLDLLVTRSPQLANVAVLVHVSPTGSDQELEDAVAAVFAALAKLQHLRAVSFDLFSAGHRCLHTLICHLAALIDARTSLQLLDLNIAVGTGEMCVLLDAMKRRAATASPIRALALRKHSTSEAALSLLFSTMPVMHQLWSLNLMLLPMSSELVSRLVDLAIPGMSQLREFVFILNVMDDPDVDIARLHAALCAACPRLCHLGLVSGGDPRTDLVDTLLATAAALPSIAVCSLLGDDPLPASAVSSLTKRILPAWHASLRILDLSTLDLPSTSAATAVSLLQQIASLTRLRSLFMPGGKPQHEPAFLAFATDALPALGRLETLGISESPLSEPVLQALTTSLPRLAARLRSLSICCPDVSDALPRLCQVLAAHMRLQYLKLSAGSLTRKPVWPAAARHATRSLSSSPSLGGLRSGAVFALPASHRSNNRADVPVVATLFDLAACVALATLPHHDPAWVRVPCDLRPAELRSGLEQCATCVMLRRPAHLHACVSLSTSTAWLTPCLLLAGRCSSCHLDHPDLPSL